MDVLDLADERFVSLTTFRRSGAAVATPLWTARNGDTLAFWTPRGTGKVKRLRNDPAVELRPCDRRGKVADSAPVVRGRAEVLDDPAVLTQVTGAIRAKYGLQFRFVTLVEKLRPGLSDRVVIAVRPAEGS